LPFLRCTQGQVVGPPSKKVCEGVGALGVVVHVRGRAEVSVVGQCPELGGDERACDGTGIHLSKYHPCRLQQSKRRVNRQELMGGARGERKGVVHVEPVSRPIPFVTGELSELFGAVRCGGDGFEELFVGAAVIAADAKATLRDVHILGAVSGGLLDYVGRDAEAD
jgi:hypothetical protein